MAPSTFFRRPGFPGDAARLFWTRAGCGLALAVAGSACRTVAPPPEPNPAVLAAMALADLARREGRVDEARKNYERALALEPGDSALYLRLAAMDLEHGRTEEAMARLQEFSRREPLRPDPWVWMARVEFSRTNRAAAVERMAEAWKRAPGDGAVCAEYGQALASADRVEEGIALWQSAIPRLREVSALAEPSVRAYLAACGKNETNRADRVREIWAALLRAAPDDAEIPLTIGRALEAADDAASARELYAEVVRRAPGEFSGYLSLVRLDLRDGRMYPAVARLRDAAERNVQPLPARRLLAAILMTRARTASAPEKAVADYREAAVQWRAVLNAEPGEESARVRLGLACARIGDWAKAVDAWRDVAADDVSVRHDLARQLAQNTPPETVASALASASGFDDRLVRYFRADLLSMAGRRSEARALWSRLASEPPAEGSVFARLAVLRAGEEGFDAAVQSLEEGLRRRPGDPDLLMILGSIRILQGRPAEAQAAFGRIGRFFRGGDEFEERLAVYQSLAFLYDGRHEDAWRSLNRAVKRTRSASVFIGAADFFNPWTDGIGDTRTLLARLREAYPGSATIAVESGLFELDAKNYGATVVELNDARRLVRADPETAGLAPMVEFYRACALERMDRLAEAEPILRAAVESNPEDHEALNYLAFAWADRNVRLEEAAAFVDRALKCDPDNAAYLDTRGWVRFRQGKPADALADLKAALERAPKEAEILDHMGDVLGAMGRPDEAMKFWTQAYVAAPETAGLRRKLEQAGLDVSALAPRLREERDRRRRDLEPLLGLKDASGPVDLDDDLMRVLSGEGGNPDAGDGAPPADSDPIEGR